MALAVDGCRDFARTNATETEVHMGKVGKGLIWLFVLGTISAAIQRDRTPVTGSETAAATVSTGEAAAKAEPAKPKGEVFRFSRYESAMGEGAQYARLDSESRHEFDFPYRVAGGSTATLTMRLDDKKGSKIEGYFSIDKGQILCSPAGCEQRIKIGSGPIKTFQGISPADSSSDTLFLPDRLANEVYQAFKAGQTVVVEINFFRSGQPQWVFKPAEALDEKQFLSAK